MDIDMGLLPDIAIWKVKRKPYRQKKTLFGTKSKTDQGCLKNYIVLKNYMICIKLTK